MAIHRKLKTTALEAVASVAQTALATARSQLTSTNGTISVRNADGTRTVIGVGAGTDETGGSAGVAQFVGDTTPPSAPTGVTFAASANHGVIGIWPGTLEEGIPADFDRVEFRFADGIYAADDDSADLYGTAWGSVQVSGSAESVELSGDYGTALCVAVAIDSNGNESDPSEEVEVDLVDYAADMQELSDSASDAKDLAEELAASITDITVTVTGLSTTVSGAVETANSALSVSSTVEQTLTSWQAEVDAVLYQTDKDGNVTSIADMVTSLETTLEGIVAYVGEDYADTTLGTLLSQYATTEWTESAIDSVVSSTLYETDEDGNIVYDDDGNPVSLYATSTEVEQTAEDITTYIDTQVSGIDTTMLIRESGDGVEVARLIASTDEDGEIVYDDDGEPVKEYTSSRTLMSETGFEVDINTGTGTEPEWQEAVGVDVDGMTVYADGEVAAEYTGEGATIYENGNEGIVISEDGVDIYRNGTLGMSIEPTYGVSFRSGSTRNAYIRAKTVDDTSNTQLYSTKPMLVQTDGDDIDIDAGAGEVTLSGYDNNLNVPAFIGRNYSADTDTTTSLTAGTKYACSMISTYSDTYNAATKFNKYVAVKYSDIGCGGRIGSISTGTSYTQGIRVNGYGLYYVHATAYFKESDDEDATHLLWVVAYNPDVEEYETVCEQQGDGHLIQPHCSGLYHVPSDFTLLVPCVRAGGVAGTLYRNRVRLDVVWLGYGHMDVASSAKSQTIIDVEGLEDDTASESESEDVEETASESESEEDSPEA